MTLLRLSSWLSLVALCLGLAGCSQNGRAVSSRGIQGKGETFGYRRWVSPDVEPDVVLIGIHGFCGASLDYRNLGEHLMRLQPTTALYAYEVRGQGSDPIHERRGDIGRPSDWYADLRAFTQLVREQHPKAKVVWYGESMGALIAVHAWDQAPAGHPPCDGLVLSSPIVRFRDDIPDWTPGLVQVAATALPLARISLQTLMGGQDIQMTAGAKHMEQANKNPYHVEAYTLRLIGTLSQLIGGMNDCASRIHSPLLVLHGEHDYFNNDRDMRGFMARLPQGAPATYHNYLGAYHLLMYDKKREKVFDDVRVWVDRLRNGRPQTGMGDR